MRCFAACIHDAKLGHDSLTDKKQSRRLQTATDEAHQNYTDGMIKENHHISQQATANKNAVSHK
jgi:hypothetical protein